MDEDWVLIWDLEKSKNYINLDPEGSEIKENGRLGRVLGALGALLGIFGAFGREFLAKLGEDGRKMSEVGVKLAVSPVQDGP